MTSRRMRTSLLRCSTDWRRSWSESTRVQDFLFMCCQSLDFCCRTYYRKWLQNSYAYQVTVSHVTQLKSSQEEKLDRTPTFYWYAAMLSGKSVQRTATVYAISVDTASIVRCIASDAKLVLRSTVGSLRVPIVRSPIRSSIQ